MQRTERNGLIWHIGTTRANILLPDFSEQRAWYGDFDPNSIPSWDYKTVSEWVASFEGMAQYSRLFCDHMVDGGRLLTTDYLGLEKMGIKNPRHALFLENRIRELNQSKRLAVGRIDTFPYFYYQALNLGRTPSHRFYGELLYDTGHNTRCCAGF